MRWGWRSWLRPIRHPLNPLGVFGSLVVSLGLLLDAFGRSDSGGPVPYVEIVVAVLFVVLPHIAG